MSMVLNFLLSEHTSEDGLERYYHIDDTSEEELNSIRSRVWLIEDDVLAYKSLSYPTLFAMEVVMDEIERLSAGLTEFYHYSDITEVRDRGTAELRHYVADRVNKMEGMIHIIYVYNTNRFMRTVVKYFMRLIQIKPFSVVKNHEDALNVIKELRSKRGSK